MPARNQLDTQQGWLAACAWLRNRAEERRPYSPEELSVSDELDDAADDMAEALPDLPHWLTKLNTP